MHYRYFLKKNYYKNRSLKCTHKVVQKKTALSLFQKKSGLSWRLRLRSATRKIHIRLIHVPGTLLARSSARIRFADSRGRIVSDQSLSHHSSCYFQEAVDVRAGNVVWSCAWSELFGCFVGVVVDVRHDLLEFRIDFFASP